MSDFQFAAMFVTVANALLFLAASLGCSRIEKRYRNKDSER